GISGRVHPAVIALAMNMDDAAPASSPPTRSTPIWRRPVSRRAVLATGAAGAGAAALAVLWKGNDLSQILNRVQDLTRANQGALSDPRVRAGHLLRLAGSGGPPAEIDRFAAMTTAAMTQAVLEYQQTSNSSLDAQLPTLDL